MLFIISVHLANMGMTRNYGKNSLCLVIIVDYIVFFLEVYTNDIITIYF